MTNKARAVQKNLSPRKKLRRVLSLYELYLFLLPALTYFAIYHYWPMYGVQIAFRDFRANLGITGSPYVGIKHFARFLNLPSLGQILGNTLGISVYALLVGFPIPIALALIINELKRLRYKRLVQTVSYAPHFISTVVIVGMLMTFLNAEYGIVNTLLSLLGGQKIDFFSRPEWFKTVYVLSGVWQNMGWNSIIYISALAGIDPSLHEAAMVDGASRLERIWHVNLPGILPTITILFILSAGNLMSVGYEKIYLMQNALVSEASEVISTYVYKVGLLNSQFSFSAAVGLCNSVVNFVLLLSVNAVARRLSGTGLW